MKRLLLLAVAVVWCGAVWAADVTLKGSVRCEGKGVAAVVVTDGEHFTQTDAKGRFELLSSDEMNLVYITIPAGYSVAAEQSVPQFWQKIEPGKKHYDFELQRKAQDDTHHGFVVMADPQIWHKKEFPALREGMADIRQTVEGYKIPFHGICCGDVISYDHTFYPTYNEVATTSGLSFFSTPGT
ncbi:MAG: serine/threonine protein phosphatase, partial [Alistipes sp.]|nr:serine/threonine protein phosphatase [Alistipes sp.]